MLRKTFILCGVGLALMTVTLNAGAYHSRCSGPLGISSCSWDNTAGMGLLGGPLIRVDTPLVEVTVTLLCESDGLKDPENPAPVAHGGFGGVCYADSGYATPGGYPPVAADAPTSTNWGEVTPTGGVGAFFIRVGNNAHSCLGVFGFGSGFADEFQYRESLAFWMTNGHVTLSVDEPLTAGGYTGTTGVSDPGFGYCNATEDVAIV